MAVKNRIQRLAPLALVGDSVGETIAVQMGSILGYVGLLSRTAVPDGTADPLPARVREDAIETFDADVIVARAPRVCDRAFEVPLVLGVE